LMESSPDNSDSDAIICSWIDHYSIFIIRF
jgi:hypothetical protein